MVRGSECFHRLFVNRSTWSSKSSGPSTLPKLALIEFDLMRDISQPSGTTGVFGSGGSRFRALHGSHPSRQVVKLDLVHLASVNGSSRAILVDVRLFTLLFWIERMLKNS